MTDPKRIVFIDFDGTLDRLEAKFREEADLYKIVPEAVYEALDRLRRDESTRRIVLDSIDLHTLVRADGRLREPQPLPPLPVELVQIDDPPRNRAERRAKKRLSGRGR